MFYIQATAALLHHYSAMVGFGSDKFVLTYIIFQDLF